MIFDEENLYSDGQDVEATTFASDEDIDHGGGVAPGPAATPGIGKADLHVYAQLTVAQTGAAGDTIRLDLEQSATGAWGGEEETILSSPTHDWVAGAPAGTVLLDVRQPNITKRFTRINYVAAGTLLLLGRIKAGLVSDVQDGVPQL